MFGGVCGGAYLIPLTGMMIPYSFGFSIGVFGFLISAGFSVFVSLVVISPNRQSNLQKLKTKKSLGMLTIVLVGICFAGMYGSVGINPILHAMYSEEHMQKVTSQSEIVQKYQELYPENTARFVDYPGVPPAIVFEMEQDNRMARLMVGGFENENLGYGFSCSTLGYHEDMVFYVNVKSIEDIADNICFTK